MSKPRPALVALTRARVLEFIREPEAVFWVFAFPIIMALVLGFAFRDKGPDKVPVGIAGGGSAGLLAGKPLASPALKTTAFATLEEGLQALRTGKIALLVENGDPLVYHFDPTRPDARLARLEVDDAIQRAAGRRDPVAVERSRDAREGLALHRLPPAGNPRPEPHGHGDLGHRLRDRERAPEEDPEAHDRHADAEVGFPARRRSSRGSSSCSSRSP